MASNLAAIGFDFRDGDELEATMLPLAAAAIEQLDCEAGSYVIWRSRTGAEIWFHVAAADGDPETREITGLTPFFEGENEVELEIFARGRRPDDNAFEGAFNARVGPAGREIVVDAVDFAAHSGRELPFACRATLVAFAHAISLGAAGTAPSTREPAAGAAALVTLHGVVREFRRFTNEVTAADFVWMSLDCGGLALDVVAEPAVVPTGLSIGAYLAIACALLGRLTG